MSELTPKQLSVLRNVSNPMIHDRKFESEHRNCLIDLEKLGYIEVFDGRWQLWRLSKKGISMLKRVGDKKFKNPDA